MTPNDQDKPTNASAHHVPSEQCAGCGAALVEDQRYCLQCGARRGLPRLDFSAFWPGLSLTGTRPEREAARTGASGGATGGSWFASGWGGGGAPSRRAIGVLVACVLTVGILAGAALGPSPSGSPADAATLAQRAISALIARTSSTPPASTPTSSTPPPESEPSSTPSGASGKESKAASKATSDSEPAESSSGGESSSGTQTSEESPSEGSSKNSGKGKKTEPGTPIKLPAVKHVWVIALSGTSFKAALADSKVDPYLAKQLVPKGTLLSNYKLSASSSLANGIALLAGQSVNLDTEQNCPTYSELQPPTVNATTGLAEGVGCVYPATVKTLADELSAGALTWKAYVQDMEAGASTAPAGASGTSTTPTGASGTTPTTGTAPATSGVTCRRPELGATDPNHTPVPGDPYLTYRNPFVYFNSLLSEGACASNDVDFTQLQGDLATPANTPSLSWIVPSACNDGSTTPCAPGAPGGLAPVDSFLKEVVPQILASTAYSKEGLIVIVPDSPPSSPASAASEPVGALLLSPFVHSGARVSESFNDFSLLKSISLLFGVLPLGHANDPSTVSFGATVYGSSGKAASAATTAKKAAQAASAAQPRRQAASQTGG
jgi:phosphatidylinositol-3-phosphatase